nr:unnamed protein product [Callosobruchus chinensis]
MIYYHFLPEEKPLVSIKAPFLQEGPVGSCECNSCGHYCISNNYIGGFCYGTSCYCVKYQ